MPSPLGLMVVMTTFVDASFASNRVTRRSHTGFIIFINRAPIIYYSKKQTTVETSAFSSEFIALRTCLEHIVSLRHKLRMFGVEVDGPAHVFCDNQSVVNNTTNVESKLHKKHNSLAYHAVRWAVSASIIRIAKIPSSMNIADALTKLLSNNQREHLFSQWTY